MRVVGSLLVVMAGLAFSAETELRRETSCDFAIDAAFQDAGGVQYFYALVPPQPSPDTDATFVRFKPFDPSAVFDGLSSPPHVVLSRLTYTVEKDVSFFTEARARDPGYINAVAKDMEVTKRPDGSFRVGAAPSNTFTIEYFDAARLAAGASSTPAIARALELSNLPERPTSVVFQQNRDFARIMGVRTADGSFTWTLHYAIAPGRTRLVVLTMSYLRTLPPFFLGGAGRVFRESTEGARALIDSLRAYQP